MKAVTISQPYASLIASGSKWIENRTWPTRYRGEIAIHAGKGLQYLDRDELTNYPSGCVIAIGNLVACVPIDEIEAKGNDDYKQCDYIPGTRNITWGKALQHEHSEGPWCWILEDLRAVDHVPVRGAQGLWEYEKALLTSAI